MLKIWMGSTFLKIYLFTCYYRKFIVSFFRIVDEFLRSVCGAEAPEALLNIAVLLMLVEVRVLSITSEWIC